MSELSYLEKLLDGAEVEWLPLSSLCNLITTGKLNANAMEDNGAYPFFTCNEEPYRINTYAFDLEAILISGNGSQVGHLNYYNGKFNAYQRTYILGGFNENVDIMYLYYYLMHTLKPYIHKNSRKGSVPYITMPMLENFKFPIPCPNNLEKSLAIQSEIVRILDKFTALTAELTAELTMRKKQYNYYRDQLLSFDEGEVEWKTLGAIGKFTYGYAAKAQISGDARFVRITDINTNGKLSPFEPMFVDISAENEKYTLKKNDLLMARTGATFGKTMIFEEDYPAIYAGFLIKLSLDRDIIDPKYYWHFAQSDYFWEQANKLVSGGGQPQFNANALKQIKVPIPYPNEAGKSLSEQARIVSVLDKFDILASSITEGLPREIELRQKQYEYYRDLLFSFPKPEIASY
ncbi:restriction endonuclease subunit S [Escherichia coli]|uniref:restriction endonuclease subunit S n=1 Tax=Enterobacter kobei TaxID=208224 RepID=UPI0019B1BEB8|nr:restriction endonuclease subunit S [Enterobacter kobei]EGF2685056.1 restriction endonuclease subunit S [Shigella sonnei]EGI4441397.1 restriction endonuclease subunit S [Escherichia coli]EMF1626704.1 restriction endonuclease subunit S [Escherichia coli]MCR2773743.1 restriction endonuclease subunit S [Enterobacter kobei]